MTSNDVNNIISDIITHPDFINSIQNVIRRNENTDSGQNLPSASSTNSLASSQTVMGPRNQNLQEEMRRLFPSIRSAPSRSGSHPRKRKHCEANMNFKRDVILVNSPSIEKTLTGKQKSYSYDNGKHLRFNNNNY